MGMTRGEKEKNQYHETDNEDEEEGKKKANGKDRDG